MKLSYLYQSADDIKYPGVLLRFPICLLISAYLVMYGEPEGFFEFLVLPHFYTALFPSFGITLIVSEIIYISTKVLDHYFVWTNNWYYRILLQFLMCVIIPVLIVCFWAKEYFIDKGVVIDQTNYLKYDITVVVCFILLLNCYYLINYLIKVKFEQQKKKLSNYHQAEHMEVAVIYIEQKISMAINFEGKYSTWPKTLKESLDSLPASDYFLINRSEIIHRDCIESYVPGDSRTLVISLKSYLKVEREFIVSQRKVTAFKQWYHEL